MFIPKSNIVETGYDQGDRFTILSNGKSYKGFYHKDNTNKYWSGQEHTNESILLLEQNTIKPITLEDLNKKNPISYGFTKHYDFNLNTTLYKGNFVIPTDDDYNKGYYMRYAAQLKLSKNPYIVELSKNNYDALLQDIVSLRSYNTVTLLWKLTGPTNDIYNNNIRTTSGIKDTNLRSLQQAEKTIPGISTIFTDPLQFARVTK